MKERFAKMGNKTRMIAGALALLALMAVNVQIGMNDGSTTDVSLLGLEASVFAPEAVATGGDWFCGQCEDYEFGEFCEYVGGVYSWGCGGNNGGGCWEGPFCSGT